MFDPFPPEEEAEADPSDPPIVVTTAELPEMVSSSGSVISTPTGKVTEHPEASLTVIGYVAAGRPVKVLLAWVGAA